MPSMSKKSEQSNLVSSSGALVGSGHSWNNVVFSKNPHSGQKLVNEVIHSEKQRNAQDSCNFLLKGLTGTSQSNLCPMADNQIMECPMSGCSTMSKLAGIRGPDNGCQSISAYIDSISKSGNLFISRPNLQNTKTTGKDSDVSRFSNLKECDIVCRDAVPSNIELRLGQPSQQSQTLGNSVLPVFGSHLFDTLGDTQKSLFLEQLIHNTRNSMATEECRQYLQNAAGTSNSSVRREQSQLNLVNHASGIVNTIDAANIEQFKGDEARGSVISMLLSHLKTPAEGKLHCRATNNVVNGNEHVMPRTPCESYIAKCDPINFPWNRGDGTERQLSINEMDLHKHMDNGKRVGRVADVSHVATESSFNFPTKHVETSRSLGAVANGTGHHSCSAIHDKSSSHLYQFSGLPPDASDGRNAFNYFGKISCLGCNGHFDNVFLRSISSPMDPGSILPSQAVSTGFSATTSISVPSLTPALPNKDGIGVSPYLLDENLRMISCRHIMESSNQDHAITSFGTNQEKGRSINSCGVKLHGSIVHPSMSKEQVHGPNITGKQEISEVAMKSLQSDVTRWMGFDSEKLAPVAGLNKWCDFSTFSQGNSLHSKEMETHSQLSRDPHPDEQSSLRLGRSENNIIPSSEHGNCCHRVPYSYFPGKCSCAVHTNCLARNCDFKGKTSLDAFKEQAGSVGAKASLLFSSKFNEDCSSPKEKVISLGQSGKLNWQIPEKVDCHSYQWRDVPSKVTGMCNMMCKDLPANLLGARVNVEDQITDAAAKRFNRSAQDAESVKEQEMSNISSGSAPVVTQASVEVNNMDSCTVDAGDNRYTNNIVVDEGSGIDKCWSSDDALDSDRSAEYLGFTRKINLISKGSSKAIPNPSSRSLIDELRLRDSLRLKKVQNQMQSTIHEKTDRSQKFERGFKTGKRKRATKFMMLDASFPASDQEISHNCACSTGPSIKRRWSAFSSPKTIPRKRDLHRLYSHREGENDYQSHLKVDECVEIPEASAGKKFRLDRTAPTSKQFHMQEPNCADTEMKCNSVDCMITSFNQPVSVFKGKERPVVCGKYGVISNGDSLKPVKIISLRKILETARRCTLPKNDESRLTFMKELKTSVKGSNGCLIKFSNSKKERDNEGHDATVCSELDPDIFMKETEPACFAGGKERNNVSHMLEKKRYEGSEKNHNIPDSDPGSRSKPKCKEIRKRSLYELTIKGKDSSCANFSAIKVSECVPQTKCQYLGKFLKNAEDGKCRVGEIYNAKKSNKEHQCQSSTLNFDAFCCVCGSSNKDETNCLLECAQCLIRVHQACYGVSKVPKARWYCRPCRTSSKNIVCVLCGYGDGAMTRALQSRNIVKSLLKAWNIVTESRPKNTISPYEALVDQLSITTSNSGLENNSFPVMRHVNVESSSTAVGKMDPQKQLDSVKNSSYSSSNLKVDNSITAGVLDSTVKQWVHMVCGLWTPGTRCPNVDTMSAFDVSGACPKGNVVCSICNRPGGSCIQCRVVDCSIQFHPWCAHQKGLLQSEVEGVDNENVGFYGRCVLHATYHQGDSDGDLVDTDTSHPVEKELTCARTEGYKGRKREGFQHNLSCQSSGNGGCLVPQEQLNAWLHINGQKSRTKGLPKLPISDIEYDCRKEYARYKQSKGWKHLVVYKSGIHALGLYTSRFICRGAMVVEYVGEIVGLRVADKRESEYQSGRKLQYKSACYFFRIDKEHIIDATRKGGIARFVNHSCLPNCVAKVISVRNEKKVVFFAERDIYPGEEITYDYHFNHEDEGKKIPCFCNSKNCRRYLN
uniref:Uncharacterized protein n=1 Tax=Davidia involucrata TaxID=16924 RepID=A0A5B7B2P3_DAVIN